MRKRKRKKNWVSNIYIRAKTLGPNEPGLGLVLVLFFFLKGTEINLHYTLLGKEKKKEKKNTERWISTVHTLIYVSGEEEGKEKDISEIKKKNPTFPGFYYYY